MTGLAVTLAFLGGWVWRDLHGPSVLGRPFQLGDHPHGRCETCEAAGRLRRAA